MENKITGNIVKMSGLFVIVMRCETWITYVFIYCGWEVTCWWQSEMIAWLKCGMWGKPACLLWQWSAACPLKCTGPSFGAASCWLKSVALPRECTHFCSSEYYKVLSQALYLYSYQIFVFLFYV